MNERDLIPNLTSNAWWNPNVSDATIDMDDRYAMGSDSSL